MYRAVGQFTSRLVPEEWARVGEFFKDALVIKKCLFVGIHVNRGLFTGIIIINEKPVVSIGFLYGVNIAKVAAAFATLETLKGQGSTPIVYSAR